MLRVMVAYQGLLEILHHGFFNKPNWECILWGIWAKSIKLVFAKQINPLAAGVAYIRVFISY